MAQQIASAVETHLDVYRDIGPIAAVATLFRDNVSLAVEAAMERAAGDEEILTWCGRRSETFPAQPLRAARMMTSPHAAVSRTFSLVVDARRDSSAVD